MYGGATNVEHEMYEYTCNNWSNQNSDKWFRVKFGSHTRKTFNRFNTKDSPALIVTHNMKSTAVFGKYVYFL
jgi:hypothetical protein